MRPLLKRRTLQNKPKSETIAAMGPSFQTARNRARAGYSAILLALLIAGLIGYKGLSGLSKLQQVRASGSLELRDDILRMNQGTGDLEFLRRSVRYLQIVWPALLFGILIAAGVHAFVSPTWFLRGLGAGAVREQVTAVVAGAPMMLCSCCASPVFSAVYGRSRRLWLSLGTRQVDVDWRHANMHRQDDRG